MRASALSDHRVIKLINTHYVALGLNVTTEGFPTDKLPALKLLENVYNKSWRSEFGFASCFALDDKGKMILGSNWLFEDVDMSKVDTTIQFDPENYLKFLTRAAERYKRLVAIQTSPNILEKVNGWRSFLVELGTDMRKAVDNMVQFRTQTALA
mmetsp:Transcript_7953/g.10932  ORF Transcript_7953/g.10932 Transcript_7953/m.10932 type:complete len:154 (-) Transcript_7953:148-609(-)